MSDLRTDTTNGHNSTLLSLSTVAATVVTYVPVIWRVYYTLLNWFNQLR